MGRWLNYVHTCFHIPIRQHAGCSLVISHDLPQDLPEVVYTEHQRDKQKQVIHQPKFALDRGVICGDVVGGTWFNNAGRRLVMRTAMATVYVYHH